MLLVTAVQPSTGGRSADDDILRCRTLQIDGVNDGISDQAEKGQNGCQRVDADRENKHRCQPETKGKNQCLGFTDMSGRNGPVHRAFHLGIDAAIENMIDRGRR